MADIGINTVTTKVSAGFSAGTQAMIYIIMIAAVLGILFTIFYMMGFKHRVRVRKIINGRTVVIDDKAKIIKSKGGTTWWKLFKHKAKIPAPPSDCVDMTNKGKLICEFFRTEDETYIPVRVNFNYTDFKDVNRNSFKAFPTTQRSLLINELTESKNYLKKTWSDLLTTAIPYIAVIMILAIFMLFFGEVVEPTKNFASQLTQTAESMNDNLLLMQDIVLERERLRADEGEIVRDDVVKSKSGLLPD